MPCPPDVRHDSFVDAAALAIARSEVEQTYATADLPRLADAGVSGGSALRASFQFSEYEAKPAVDGQVTGRLVLTCQRCMGPVEIEIDERVQVLIVAEERADEPGGYEPVAADAARLDLRWLVEDQVLLALPLVAMHANTQCRDDGDRQEPAAAATDSAAAYKPFQNLRDMMRKR
jgi:uncharacterized protein